MKKKASNFKLLPSQSFDKLSYRKLNPHKPKVAPVFNFYRALHFFVSVLFATVSKHKKFCSIFMRPLFFYIYEYMNNFNINYYDSNS